MTNIFKRKNSLRNKLKKFLLIIALIQSSLSFGQELPFYFGKIVDSKNGAPLAFASIVQKNKSVGLISNDNGTFKIPTYFAVANVTVVVSFIGYYSEEILVSDLDRNKLNIIKLVEKTEFLNEVVVKNRPKNLTAEGIVKLAIKNIKNNYPFDDFSYVGYYRDYQKTRDNTYVNLNEAILHVYDAGFGFKDYAATYTQIYKYTKNLSFPIDTVASRLYDYTNNTKVIDNARLGYLSKNVNEFSILRVHDAIRNYNINTYDFVNNLESDFVRNHAFEMVRETSLNDISLYEIKTYKYIDNIYAEGKIFISKDDYKIYKLQYAVYQRKEGNSRKNSYTPVLNKGELIINIIVEYADYNETMYPKYISFNNPFEVTGPPKFFPVDAKFGFVRTPPDNTILFVDMIFNNKVSPKKAYKKKNYKLRYKGSKIKIDSIKVKEDTVRIWPKDSDMYFPKRAWLEDGLRLSGKDFSLEVKNIEDIDGNVVFQDEIIPYSQYREFFIQELKLDTKKPKNVQYMIKNQPIFKNQPIGTSEDISKYWMNTPLKE